MKNGFDSKISAKREAAVKCFEKGFCCSQAVFSAFAEEYGLDLKPALKIADAFGGGMSMSGTCGAVTGALMAIGLKYGRTEATDTETKAKTRGLIEDFYREFQQRHKHLDCKGLLGYDLTVPEEKAIIDEKKLTNTICPNYVADAAEIVETLINRVK